MSQIFDNAYLSINGLNVSADVQQLDLDGEVETQDNTSMGDTTRSSLPGLKNWNASVTFIQDYTDGGIDSKIAALVGVIVPIEIRPDNSAVSASNPRHTGYCFIKTYKPIGGKVGDLLVSTVEIVPAKSGAHRADLVRSAV